MTSDTTSTGCLVRDARIRSGISQRSLARRAGTSQAAISRIERGLEQPTVERLEQILAGLGWRPVISLEPIAEHREEPRRLYQAERKSPSARFADGLSVSRFARSLDEAVAVGERTDR
jgi:transcriptional regulator with XRE-family HTH domain